MKSHIIKLSLFLFGSFSFGWVLGTVFHELGHAISVWVTGGRISHITINPFSWSYTYYASSPRFPAFSSWAGMLLGSGIGLILLFIVTRRHTPFLFPFVLAGALPILKDGGYYLVDILIGYKGDATDLVQLGIPKYIVLAVGVLWLILGLYLLISLINLSGVRPDEPFTNRLVLFGFGILPYFQLSAIYTMIYAKEDIVLEIVTILLVVALVIVVSFASSKLSRRKKEDSRTVIEWRHTTYALFLGIMAIVIPFLIFGL